MKIIFAGTPQAAAPTLNAILSSSHEVVAVLTRPDAPVGRKRVLTPSPIASLALDRGIPIIYADKIEAETQAVIDSYDADLGVVVAYGALLPQTTLDSLEHGWMNLHFSQLPQWRGAAPVQWQILSGAQVLGSSVFSLVQELDAGDVYDSQAFEVVPDETSGEALERLSVLGASQVLSVVDAVATGTANPIPQQGESTYARKLTLEDGHLDTSSSADRVYNQFRGVTPEPGAFVLLDADRVKILAARLAKDVKITQSTMTSQSKKLYLGCADGSLEILTLQPAGKQAMSAMDWFRGLHQEVVTVS